VDQPSDGSGIRLLLLDDQALFRAGLARLLELQSGLEVVSECGDANEAIEILGNSKPDVVLLDFEHAMEGEGGFLGAARRRGYRGRFLIVAGAADLQSSALAIRLGASGIFLKTEGPERLVQAIRMVANGAVWFDRRIIQILTDLSIGPLTQPDEAKSAQALSDREQRVLLGILSGQTNRKIGTSLGISEGAVKGSVRHLFHKTGVRTRSQLVRAALEGSLGATRDAAADSRCTGR
jgi:DNA-binding NarL/FixJ family response regulator